MISTHIQGIPCQVEVVRASYQRPWRGSKYSAPSDWDYTGGWYNIEYDVYDRRGYRAKWLEDKITPDDHKRIIEEIEEEIDPEDW